MEREKREEGVCFGDAALLFFFPRFRRKKRSQRNATTTLRGFSCAPASLTRAVLLSESPLAHKVEQDASLNAIEEEKDAQLKSQRAASDKREKRCRRSRRSLLSLTSTLERL